MIQKQIPFPILSVLQPPLKRRYNSPGPGPRSPLPPALIISTFLTPLRPSYSTSLFSLGTSLLAPLLSSPLRYSCSILIFHVFLHLPSLRSNTIQSDHPTQIYILNSDCSTHSPLYLLLSALHCSIGKDQIGLDQPSLAQLAQLCSVFCSSEPSNLS